MAGSRKHTGGTPDEDSRDWFERELAQLNAQLDDIAAWLKTRPATPAPLPPWRPSAQAIAEPSVPIGRGLAAATQAPAANELDGGAASGRDAESGTESDQPAAAQSASDTAPGAAPAVAAVDDRGPAATAATQAAAVSAEPPRPTGTDLSDPKNFGLMPPTGELEQGSASAEEYRQRLSKHLAFATTVLHTSKVPAAVWREWRAFEKAIHERLLALTAPAKPET